MYTPTKQRLYHSVNTEWQYSIANSSATQLFWSKDNPRINGLVIKGRRIPRIFKKPFSEIFLILLQQFNKIFYTISSPPPPPLTISCFHPSTIIVSESRQRTPKLVCVHFTLSSPSTRSRSAHQEGSAREKYLGKLFSHFKARFNQIIFRIVSQISITLCRIITPQNFVVVVGVTDLLKSVQSIFLDPCGRSMKIFT